MDEELRSMLTVIIKEIRYVKDDVQELKEGVKVLKEDVSVLKEDVKELKEDIDVLKGDRSRDKLWQLLGEYSSLRVFDAEFIYCMFPDEGGAA